MKSLILFLVVLITFLSNPCQLFGQKKYHTFLEFSYDQGQIVDNKRDWSTELINLIGYSAIDFRVGWRSKENTLYNYLNRYPIFGVGYTSTLKYYQEIGRPMAVYGFGEFPFGKKSVYRKVNFSYYVQVGLGFGINPYNVESNPLNQFMGSDFNAHIAMGFKGNYQFSKTLALFTSFGFKHYSNGSTKKPNSGINFIPISIGLRANLSGEEFIPNSELNIPPLEKRGYWNIASYNGMKAYDIGEKSYYRGGVGVNYLWEFSYKYRMGIGVDWFYSGGLNQRYPDKEINFLDNNSFAIVGSWEWKFARQFYMPIAIGVYINQSELNQEVSSFYERIGIRYKMKNNLFAGVQIKAHKAKADFFEFTVGYTIPGKVKRVVVQETVQLSVSANFTNR